MKNKILLHIKKNKLLAIIIFFAIFIRLVGVFPGYPNVHPDEAMSFGSVFEMLTHNDLNPRRFDYPSGVPIIHYFIYAQFILPFVLFKIFFLDPSLIFDFLGRGSIFYSDFQVKIFGYRQVYALFWSRHITAVLGAISVFVTFLAASKLFGKKTGLFATFFLAFNYRHVLSSHFALSDAPNSFFAILAFYASALLLEKNTRRKYILAGFCVGLSFSIKYQIFSLLPFLFVHFLWFFRKQKLSYLFNKNFLLALIIIPLTFTILNPYLLLNLKTAIPVIQYVGGRYGAGVNTFNFYPLYYLFYFGVGPLPFVAIVLGLLFGLVRYPVKTVLILFYVAPFLYTFLYYMRGGGYVRNFTTVMPLLMIFAGLFFSTLLSGMGKILKKRVFVFSIILFLTFTANFESIKNSFTLSINFLRPWNRDILQTWADEKLPKTAKIANDNLGLSNPSDNLTLWEINEESSVAELREKGFDFVVANIDWRQSLLYWWFNTPPFELIRYKPLPYKILDNSYNGIALKEFMQYSVFEVYKPWQTPELNYFVAKIPPELKNKGKEIYSFGFDKNEERWHEINIRNNRQIQALGWDEGEGNTSKGSLVYKGMLADDQTVRYVSKLIPVKAGKIYTVTGFIKTEEELRTRMRDGFLRIDFYMDSDLEKVKNGGMIKSVSARVYGTKNWVKKQASMMSPLGARFLTVSFQKSYYPGRIWFDDVKIYETEKFPEKFPDVPLIKSTMPDEVLYPNSIL